MKSTKPAQHKLCGLFYVYCRPVRIAENYHLWHPEWDPQRRVLKSRVPKWQKSLRNSLTLKSKNTKPAEKESNLFDGDGLMLRIAPLVVVN
ncbi:MAG: hypothetical protein LBE37_15530 [Sphingobacterium sp.]|nr:hypothetical protein [Sphingobacterium sp.]